MTGEEPAKKEGEQKKSGFVFLPIIYYTKETKVAAGAAAVYYFRALGNKLNSRPSSIRTRMVYTQEGQFRMGLGSDLYFQNEKFRLESNISFKNFIDKFYGIGNKTSKDMEEKYTSRIFKLKLDFQNRVYSYLNAGIRYELENDSIMEVEEGSQLAKEQILGSKGGTASGIGFFLNWDSRDNIYFPSSGSYYRFMLTWFLNNLGSDYDFTEYRLDIRKYIPLFSSHVLAFQSYMNFISGNAPFQMLSLLGGESVMRGFYRGRYRDRNLIAFQMELRIPVWRRLGFASFLGFGDVAGKISHFNMGEFKYSAGFGIRYLLIPEEKLNIRFDVGFGNDSWGIYIIIAEAF